MGKNENQNPATETAQLLKEVADLRAAVSAMTGGVPANNEDRVMRLRWAEVEPWISDKNPRPDSEIYCVMKLKPGDKFSFVKRSIEVLSDRRGKNTVDEYVPDQGAIRFDFQEPDHLIGSDIEGHIVEMIDILKNPEISITPKTLELAKSEIIRLPEFYIDAHGEKIPLGLRPGAMPFEDALRRVKDRASFIMNPGPSEFDNPCGNYWSGETFRRWAKLVYGLRRNEMEMRAQALKDLEYATDYEKLAGLAPAGR